MVAVELLLGDRGTDLLLVAEACRLIGLPHKIAWCAQSIYHHICNRKESMGPHFPVLPIVLLFIACKVEEQPSNIIQFVQALEYYIVKQRIVYPLIDPFSLQGPSLTVSIRDHISLVERFILKTLGFAVYSFADYPQKYAPSIVLRLEEYLKRVCVDRGVSWSMLIQNIHNTCNDSLLVDLTNFTGLEVAVACVVAASGDERVVGHHSITTMQVDGRVVREIVQRLQSLVTPEPTSVSVT